MQKIGNCLSIYKGVQAWYRNRYPVCTFFLYLDNFILHFRSYTGIVDSVRWSYRARPQLKYCIAEPDNTRRKTRRRKWPEMFYIPIKNLLIAVEKRAFTLVLSYIESFSQGLCCLQRKENRLYGSWRKNTTNQVDSEKRTYSVQEIEEILQISLKASCSMESGIWSIWRWLAR